MTCLLAGSAVRSIMPTREMVDNTLHYPMTVRLDQEGSPLKVKALALTFDDQQVLLVNLDLCAADIPKSNAIRKAVSKSTGVSFDNILIECTHSHSTPFLEPLDGPRPFFDFVCGQCVEASAEAWSSRRPARWGHDVAHVVGASFNTRFPLLDGRVKFCRDFREGLTSGRPVDPRLSIIRIDDEKGKPIAGFVRFAAHPACVIFNAPISAEYPGYLTDRLSETVAEGAPVLFGYGSAGDVNCIPMFGKESDSCQLGHNLASIAGPIFEKMKTRNPDRFMFGNRTIEMPLDAPPSFKVLDAEIEEITRFSEALDENPELVWVIGYSCKKDWSVKAKKAVAKTYLEWTMDVKKALEAGKKFPTTWPSGLAALIVDDLGLAFYSGEPFTQIGLSLASRSPLKETLLLGNTNGRNAYVGMDEDRLRGGYETYTVRRHVKLSPDGRPLPYALGAAEYLILSCIDLVKEMLNQ